MKEAIKGSPHQSTPLPINGAIKGVIKLTSPHPCRVPWIG